MSEDKDMSIEKVKDYYRARASSSNKYATSPDFNLREVEIEYIMKHLKDGLKVLDAGCGNGYSTLTFASSFDSEFTGLDFVPEMVQAARELAGEFTLRGKTDFKVGDVTALEIADSSVDVVISQRCLLNLPSREAQWTAIKEISRVLRPGGRYLMLEGTLQGLRKLNKFRELFALEPISEAAAGYNEFSNKFDEGEMLEQAGRYFEEHEGTERFGMYYFISRVVHPMLVAPEQPRFDARINYIARKICAEIPDFEEMGHVALFVFRK